ncbi:conjugal transfer protein, partial [Salmonella enterica]|nr:conjugal transfer protein [Salmonella enterica]
MTKRSLYALGFMIPGIFSPLPGVSATTPTVSPLPPPPSMSVYLSPEADDHNGV